MLHIIQPEIPKYRVPFFKLLTEQYKTSIKIYFSEGKLGALNTKIESENYVQLGEIKKIIFGLFYQRGVEDIEIKKHDIVVVCGNIRHLSAVYLVFKCRLIGANVIWWGHLQSSTSKATFHIIRLLFLKISNACLFYTDLEMKKYQKTVAYNRKIFALNNGLNTNEINRLRVNYVSCERRDILFIGRLTDKSELAVLFEALKLMDPNIHVHVIGDGQNAKILCELATKLGVNDRVVWHGALVDEVEISKIVNKIKLFVYPGSVGLSLLHAFSYGIPAVVHSSEKDHMPEFAAFKCSQAGFLFERNNIKSLANKINMLYVSDEQLNEMSKKALETTERTFNVNDMVARFNDMVENVDL